MSVKLRASVVSCALAAATLAGIGEKKRGERSAPTACGLLDVTATTQRRRDFATRLFGACGAARAVAARFCRARSRTADRRELGTNVPR